jgi:hypothetical protein
MATTDNSQVHWLGCHARKPFLARFDKIWHQMTMATQAGLAHLCRLEGAGIVPVKIF